MKKIITIPIFIALCAILFASCSQRPIPAFTRAKSDGNQVHHKSTQVGQKETVAEIDTLETASAALSDTKTEENASQADQKTEVKLKSRMIVDQLKNIDRSQLSKKQQKLLNKLDRRIEKLENRPNDTHANGALTTGLVLILAGLILLVLGTVLRIFGLFGIIFIAIGLIFLLVGIIQAAD